MAEKIVGTGMTFDDVLLVPAKSSVHPSKTDVTTHLTKKIKLNIPVVSAAMDTVTEAEFAIALAREGGIGFVHKNMSPEAQAGHLFVEAPILGLVTELGTLLGVSQAVIAFVLLALADA